MDLDEIKKIIALMEEHELSFFHLNKEGNELKLKRGNDDAITYAAPPAVATPFTAVAPAVATGAVADPAATEATAPVGEQITSPMVGTFYRSPSPEADVYSNVGDRVEENTTVCIIESMKVMNEIKAETSGVIAKILVKDGTPVQFGEPLFELE